MSLSRVIARIAPAVMITRRRARAEHDGWPCREAVQTLSSNITQRPFGIEEDYPLLTIGVCLGFALIILFSLYTLIPS